MAKPIVLSSSGLVTPASGVLGTINVTGAGSADTVVNVYDAVSDVPASDGPVTASVIATAGNLSVGTYTYKMTYVNATGESKGGTTSTTVTTSAGNTQISLTAIPIGPAGVTSRKLYRTAVGGADGTQKLLATIPDNTTTTFVDNIADASLGAVVPTSGVYTAFVPFKLLGSLTGCFQMVAGDEAPKLTNGAYVVMSGTTNPTMQFIYK